MLAKLTVTSLPSGTSHRWCIWECPPDFVCTGDNQGEQHFQTIHKETMCGKSTRVIMSISKFMRNMGGSRSNRKATSSSRAWQNRWDKVTNSQLDPLPHRRPGGLNSVQPRSSLILDCWLFTKERRVLVTAMSVVMPDTIVEVPAVE
ncbi:hypothetical protein J6590_062947 [Homalodisca vitripennis]|nr:hypothetical protein J6590_062947 [Homalodisca vitripennis]